MNKTLINILLLGVLIRLIIMVFYFHPDIKTYHFQVSFLSKGVLNIYSYLPQHRNEYSVKEEFVYFPLTYFTLGAYQFLMSPLLGSDFYSWLENSSSIPSESPNFFRYMFILKLPYLGLDIALGFLLMKFFTDPKDKQKIFGLWMLNPLSIILIYVFSNIDIIPVILSVSSVYLLKKEKIVLAALMLGLGAGFKAYPMLFLPAFVIFMSKGKIKMLLLSMGTFLAVLAPFLASKAFWEATLVSGLTTRILQPVINLGFGEAIIIPIFAIGLFLIMLSLGENKQNKLIEAVLGILLLLFSFIHFHIQWLLWIMPFIMLAVVNNRRIGAILIAYVAMGFLIPVLYQDKYMSVGLLSAMSAYFNLVPIPYLLVRKIYDPLILQSVLHTAMATFAIGSAFYITKTQK